MLKHKIICCIFLLFVSINLFAKTHYEITTSSSIRDNQRMYNNYSQEGSGGVFYISQQGTLNLLGTAIMFFTNSATQYGGAICNNGTLNTGVAGYYFNNSAQNAGALLNYPTGVMNVGYNSYFEKNDAIGENASGGAIANAGTLTISFGTKFISNTAGWDGGAISNNNMGGATLITIENNVLFSSNTAGSYGGAIRNNGSGILYIGDDNIFQYNGTLSEESYGGAIHNNGYAAIARVEIGDGTNFYSNYAGYGGAICNEYEKGNITIGSNVVFSSNSARYNGGAIFNEGILNIGNDNIFSSNTAIAYGGAIANISIDDIVGITNIGNNALFSKNVAQTDCGGAITNSGNFTIGKNATFEENSSAGCGGAIYNSARGNITIGKNVIFSNNIEQYNGGAIHNEGILTLLDGGIFTNNRANGTGGAINLYNGGTINLIADTGNVEFTGNTANGISNAIHDNDGTINLWASENADIIFNDRITSYDSSSILNINQSSGTLPTTGKIILNEDMSGYTDNVNLYGGEIELQAKTNGSNVNTNKFFSGNINLSSGTLNILNNSIDNIAINNLTTTENSNLKFDTDLSNNTSDNFTVTNSVGGELNLTAINILGVDENSGQITLFNNTKSPTLNILTTGNYGGDEYIFTNNDIAGVLNYQKSSVTKTFKEVINDTEPAIRSYSFSNDEIVTEDLGQLGGEQLTIFGNGYEVNGSSKAGITVSEGQTLNIEKGTGEDFIWKKFNKDNGSGGAIYNKQYSITTIGKNAIFSSNTATDRGGAINNRGTLEIGSNSQFEHNKTNVYGGGAIFNEGQLTIGSNVIFSSNTTTDGGGVIDNENGGTTTVGANALFEYNKSNVIGGAIRNTSDNGDFISIGNNSSFVSNRADVAGGAIWNSKEMEIKDGVTYYSNRANEFGGAIVNCIGTLTLQDNNTFNLNSSQKGGAIANLGLQEESEDGIINIGKDVTFTSNTATDGGAIYNFGEEYIALYGEQYQTKAGKINISSNSIFSYNTATQHGGAIYNGGDINISSGALFTYNNVTDSSGGAIYNRGSIEIVTDVIFASNTAMFGGAINSEDATIIIGDNANFSYNKVIGTQEKSAQGGAIDTNGDNIIIGNNIIFYKNEANLGTGGAICSGSDITIGDNASFIENNAKYSGAIYNDGTLIFGSNALFDSNSSTDYGGAIDNKTGTISFQNGVRFLNNSTDGTGGAIHNDRYFNIGSEAIFSTNSATQYGGAIYNNGTVNIENNGYYYNNSAQVGGALLNFEYGIMDIGYNSYFEKNRTTNGEGGAIENCGTLIISSGTNFVLNTATTNGGAISNAMYINGDFVANANVADNVTFSSNSAKYGGAFSNISAKATIGKNNIFEYNTSTNEGGAIYNTKNDYKDVVGQITISSNTKFLNNTALGLGGAIFNNSGIITIGSTATFNNNSAYNGGAIASLYEGSNIQIGDNVTFSSNTATNNGGAISNDGGIIFVGNNAIFNGNSLIGNSISGGAIKNCGNTGNIVIGTQAHFYENSAIATGSQSDAMGGAICNTELGTQFTIKDGAVFENNIVSGTSAYGGAIYNRTSILNLIANTSNVEFTGNTANGVSNAIHDNNGTINLWASNSANIIFNDRITSTDNTSILNINSSTTTLTANGKVILNEDMSGYTGAVNMYDGEIELQAKINGNNVNTNKFFSGNINLSSGTLNILNNSIDNITVNSLTTTSNANLKFDTDLSNNTSDNFTVTNSAIGTLNLTAINILGVDENSGQITLFNNTKSPTLNILTTGNYGGDEYIFTNNDVAGVLNYQKSGVTKTFKEVINETEPAIRSYSLSGDELVTEDLGQLGGEQLTIFGNGYEVNGSSKAGIIVSEEQQLNIEKSNWVNFNNTMYSSSDSSSILGYGGAIYNNGIISISSTIFSLNYALGSSSSSSKEGKAYGGVIYNNNGRVFVSSTIFNSNDAKSLDYGSSYGGAIYNKGYLECDDKVGFINNKANGFGRRYSGAAMFGYFKYYCGYGGAIYNDAGSAFIVGDFTTFDSNVAKSDYQNGNQGGAIYNLGDVYIGTNSNFVNNFVYGNGGAIYNSDKKSIVTIEENSSFISNKAYINVVQYGQDATQEPYTITFKNENRGGAIYNSGKIEINRNAIFDSNEVYVDGYGDNNGKYILGISKGGAIYNSYEISFDSNMLFNLNVSSASNHFIDGKQYYGEGYGGALYNYGGSIAFKDGVKFKNNIAQTRGGAIYNDGGTINLVAKTNDVEFTGNTANGVSNAIYDNKGTINLWASDDASVIFNDRITTVTYYNILSVLNINQSSGTLPTTGKIILNEDMSGYFGQVNLYDGEIELQAKTSGSNINTNKFFSGNINLSSGTLNILNNVIDNITVSTWTSTSNTNLKFDTDLSNNTSDNFTITKSVGGELNLTAINILGVDENSGQITLFNNTKSPTLNILTTGNYGGDEYIFTNNDVAGVLNYQKTGVTKTFKEVVNETEPAIRSYSLANDEIVTANLGQLGGTQLTIFGNGYEVDGNSKAGITVSNGQTLNIEKGTGEKFVWNNFVGGVIRSVEGELIFDSIIFSSNTSIGSGGAVVSNKGTLNITSTTFSSNKAERTIKNTTSTNEAYGGAIYNNSGTKSINSTSFFLNNVYSSNANITRSYGGAIFNNSGELDIALTNFSSNNARSYGQTTGSSLGGAIYNKGTIFISSTIFDSNMSNGDSSINHGHSHGGAIYNSGTIFISSTTFSSNSAIVDENNYGYGYGGAIYTTENSITTISNDVLFINNKATSHGGAIYNNGTLTIRDGVSFFNNIGGAIYNSGTLNLIANTKNIEFTGNTKAIEDLGGTINLWASSNASIIFNDDFVCGGTIININSSTTTLTANGKIILNGSDLDEAIKTVNLYNGEIELKARKQFFNGNINLNSGTLNILNNSIDNITISTWTSTANANLKFDVDLSNNTGDNFTIKKSAAGQLNLTAINILGAAEDSGQIILFKNGKSPTLNILTTGIYNGYEYTFSTTTRKGVLNYEQTGTIKTFKEVVNDTIPQYRSYSFANDEIVTEDLENLGGTQLTIFGNGYDINGNSKAGIKMNVGQTLDIEGVKEIANFRSELKGGFLDNYGGTINIGDNVSFVNNSVSPDSEGERVPMGSVINNISKKMADGSFVNAHLTIGDNVLFQNNGGGNNWGAGAAISNTGAIMEIGNNVIFDSNSAGAIESINYQDLDGNINCSIATIGDNAVFTNNYYAIGNSGEMSIGKNSTFSNNDWAISNGYGRLTVGENSLFENSNESAIANGSGFLTIGKSAKFFNNKGYDGAAIYNDNADSEMMGYFTITDGALFSNNISEYCGGAIWNGDAGIINLIANTENIEFTGNKANGISNAIYDKEGTINLWASESADIIFNDRITSEDDTSILNINSSTTTLTANGKVILNEEMTGYTGQVNLYNGTIELGEKGTLFGGNMTIDNATIDMANSIIQEHNFNALTINNSLNLMVDADLVNKKMDTISANENSNLNGKKINVKAINILTDSEKYKTKILFTNSTVLKDKITSITTASSKLYQYDVVYNDGYFNFINTNVNPEINPIILESQVASAEGLITQTTVLNQAFSSIDSVRNRIIEAKQKGLLYASTADMLFENDNRIESGLWIRPFMAQDSISFDSFDVDNTLAGTLAGIDLAAGENTLVSFYLGYAGSNQKYEDIKINQTGYIVGATGMLIKENWYAGLTANINFNKAESESDYGTDSFDMNMYSVGAKAGYNFNLSEKFVMEPNLTLMYGNVSNQEYETTQGANIDSQSTAAIIVEPQVKAKLNLTKGWQPYGLLGYVANISDKGKVVADGAEFETDKIDGYVEYGLGVNKDFVNTPWNCYLQVTGRSGGINGFSGNIGIKYSFGKKSEIKEQKKQEKEEKARLEAEEKARIAEEKRITKEEQAKQKALEEERIRKEKEEKAKLEAEEKARIAEEKRIAKEEQAKQKALEEERIRKEKEEKAKLEAEEKARIAEQKKLEMEKTRLEIEKTKLEMEMTKQKMLEEEKIRIEKERKEKEEQAKQKALEEKQKKIEMEARARLEAEEKAKIAEEKRIAKEEQEKQIELEKERIRKEKEEMKRQKQLEIERKIQENYN